MINKFIKIKGVGNFNDFNSSGDIEFGKVNLIYGDNGSGKSTLTSIIRSLKLNDSNEIINRKTIDMTDDQKIEILLRNNTTISRLNFNYKGWSNQIDFPIEIFDANFVYKNVYAGYDFGNDKQKNLTHFVLGEDNLNLTKEIEELKIKKQEINNLKKDKCHKIESLFNGMSYQNICKIEPIENSEDIILKLNEKLSKAQNADEINKREGFTQISLIQLDNLLEIEGLIKKSVADIDLKAKEYVSKHIKSTGLSDEWFKNGYDIIHKDKREKCPFCNQDIKKNEMLKYYSSYFSKEYKKLCDSISGKITELENNKIETKKLKILQTQEGNKEIFKYWKEHKVFNEEEKKCIEDDTKRIFESVETFVKSYLDVIDLLKNKLKSISEVLDSKPVDVSKDTYDVYLKEQETYSTLISQLNKKVNEYKNNLPKLENVKEEIEKIKKSKLRYNEENIKLIEEIETIEKNINKVDSEIKIKKDVLNEGTKTLLDKYGDNINNILKDFGLDFEIKEMKAEYVGSSKNPKLKYQFYYKGYPIDDSPAGLKPETTFSEGDKNAIAFALFLAKLENNIENTVVVFDDPLNSLDLNRGKKTIYYISELSKKVKQLIILTHHEGFLSQLFYNNNICVNKYFKISEGKLFLFSNIEKHMLSDYLSNLDSLYEYRENPQENCDSKISDNIRKTLEGALKVRFYIHLTKGCQVQNGDLKDVDKWTLKKGLGCMIEIITFKNNDNIIFKKEKKEVINKLNEICRISNHSHHDHSQFNENYNNCTHHEIRTYVNQTIDLIENYL